MIRAALFAFLTAIAALTFAAGFNHVGSLYVYLLFTVLANALLLNGFRRQALFFDTFIGIFLWLGFWLKFSIRVAFADGQFHEPVGAFDGSADAFDHALVIASCGFAGLLAASFVRQRLFRYPDSPPSCASLGLFHLYKAYRKTFIALFLLLVLAVAASNMWLGIYQRGMVVQTILPFGLNGVYKWLLQFGLASIAAMIIRFEIELSRNISLMAVFPPLLESLFSNVSLLSRGMILNATALGIGGLRTFRAMKIRLDPMVLAVAVITFVALFVASVFVVNYLRASSQMRSAETTHDSAVAVDAAQNMTTPLFIDRWVGIEGVMAVSSSDRLGWSLWREAWQEKFQEGQLSLYDRHFIDSPYTNPNIDKSKNHFVSLPGVVAFFYYPGSLGVLFLGLLALGGGAALFEVFTYRLAGQNWVLCSLLAQVVAFRYASFGYVPSQSYLLFGTLLLNVLIIAGVDWVIRRFLDSHRAHP